MCTTFLGDLGDSKSGNPGAIIATMLASEAAFVVEHPDKAKDINAIYFAGVDGALHSYEAIHSKDASYRSSHLDDLIQKRDKASSQTTFTRPQRNANPESDGIRDPTAELECHSLRVPEGSLRSGSGRGFHNRIL
jgi:hypothetical protein